MWCIGKLTREYRQRMYRILDLYNKPLDPKIPVVCMDEKSKQLIDDVRQPLAMKAKKVKRIDSEYRRNGTRNIFVAVEPKAGVHVAHVTKTRTKKDFAHFIRHLLTDVYKGIGKICLVLDNLNTHFARSFFETFPQKEASALLDRIEFYYTPKHGSWLNMAEIEIGILDEECIGCRIGNETKLKNTVKLWVEQRNKDKKKINWQFTKRNAYNKLSGHYVT